MASLKILSPSKGRWKRGKSEQKVCGTNNKMIVLKQTKQPQHSDQEAETVRLGKDADPKYAAVVG